jgi:hypothetical protein
MWQNYDLPRKIILNGQPAVHVILIIFIYPEAKI